MSNQQQSQQRREIFCEGEWQDDFRETNAVVFCRSESASSSSSSRLSDFDLLSQFAASNLTSKTLSSGSAAPVEGSPFEIISFGFFDVALDSIIILPSSSSSSPQSSSPVAPSSAEKTTIQALGEKSTLATAAETAQRNRSNNKKWMLPFAEISSIAKHGVLAPSERSINKKPIRRPSLQIQLRPHHDDDDEQEEDEEPLTVFVVAESESAGQLFDASCVLWRREHGLLSKLERAVLRSHSIDEALFILACQLPFEIFGTLSQQQQDQQQHHQHQLLSSSRRGGHVAGGEVGGVVGGGDQQEEIRVRVEVNLDGDLLVWRVPKDLAALKESSECEKQINAPLAQVEFARCLDCRSSASEDKTVFIVLPDTKSITLHVTYAPSSSSSSSGSSSFFTSPFTSVDPNAEELKEANEDSTAAAAASSSVPGAGKKEDSTNTTNSKTTTKPLRSRFGIVELYNALSASRPWLFQPGASTTLGGTGGSISATTSTLSPQQIKQHSLVEKLMPGAIQPFSRRELDHAHYLYFQLQSSLPTLISTATSSSSSQAKLAQHQQIGVIGDQKLFAIALQDVPHLFRNIVVRSSEASQDVFVRNLLLCVFSASSTSWSLSPWQLPEGTRLLNFGDFVFGLHLLERGGVNARMLFVYGAISRCFFHRSYKPLPFDLQTWRRTLKVLSTAFTMAFPLKQQQQQQQEQQQQRQSSNSPPSSPYHNVADSPLQTSFEAQVNHNLQQSQQQQQQQQQIGGGNQLLLATSASTNSKVVEAEAEQIWFLAIDAYGRDSWMLMDSFSQLLALIKIAHQLEISVLQYIEDALENPVVFNLPSSIGVFPGHNQYLAASLLAQGLQLSLTATAASALEEMNQVPKFAFDSPPGSPREDQEEEPSSSSSSPPSAAGTTTTPSRTSRNSSFFSSAAIASVQQQSDLSSINVSKLPDNNSEKVVYDLQRNRVKSTGPSQDSLFTKVTKDNRGVFFTDYCESTFRQIRSHFGFTDADIFLAASVQQMRGHLCFAKWAGLFSMSTSGRSKSLFLRSRCGRFIFKELPKHEFSFLRKILPLYLSHVMANPNSLLPKFLGMYKLAEYEASSEFFTYVVLMENILDGERPCNRIFDLKGSMVGRETPLGAHGQGIAAKDHEFVNDLENRGPVPVPPSFRDSILRQLQTDVQFLQRLNSTDYSLLLGVHQITRAPSSAGKQRIVDPFLIDDEIENACLFDAEHEEDEVRRTVNFCTYNSISGGGGGGNSNNLNPSAVMNPVSASSSFTSSSSLPSVLPAGVKTKKSYFQRFFGGIPSFNKGQYVLDDTPKNSSNWPEPLLARRFTQTHPKFLGTTSTREGTKLCSIEPIRVSEIIYIGLVDVLTQYDWRKKMEYGAKAYLLFKDMNNVSCSPAEFYASRFLNFAARDVFVPAPFAEQVIMIDEDHNNNNQNTSPSPSSASASALSAASASAQGKEENEKKKPQEEEEKEKKVQQEEEKKEKPKQNDEKEEPKQKEGEAEKQQQQKERQEKKNETEKEKNTKNEAENQSTEKKEPPITTKPLSANSATAVTPTTTKTTVTKTAAS